jgi:hypothetical protein
VKHLYIKEHTVTGMRYLGQTRKNPLKYRGSGLDWIKHRKEHGDHIRTIYWEAFTDYELMRELALFMSEFFDVVKSPNWANRIPENGSQGGGEVSDERREKMRASAKAQIRYPVTEETRRKLSIHHKTRPRKPHTPETKAKMTEAMRAHHARRKLV